MFAGDAVLIGLLQEASGDIFARMAASRLHCASLESVSASERETTKRVVYAFIYGSVLAFVISGIEACALFVSA